jgi:hypothetical protein
MKPGVLFLSFTLGRVQVPHAAILALALSDWVGDIPLLPGARKDPEFDERHISGQEIFNPDYPQLPNSFAPLLLCLLPPLLNAMIATDGRWRQLFSTKDVFDIYFL